MNDQTQPAPKSCSVVVGCAIVFLVVSVVLLAPVFFDHGRTPARRAACSNNLHNIALALQLYHADHGSYPPPFLADVDGKPMHSWRVLLLPYLEQKALYNEYHFDEPWDGPNNRKLHDIVLKIFLCPADDNTTPRKAETSYVAVVGPKTMWPGANSSIRDADIIDGLSNTLLVVEVADSGIHWMEPRDLPADQIPLAVNPQQGPGISSHHPGGAHLTFADGSVRFFPTTPHPQKFANF